MPLQASYVHVPEVIGPPLVPSPPSPVVAISEPGISTSVGHEMLPSTPVARRSLVQHEPASLLPRTIVRVRLESPGMSTPFPNYSVSHCRQLLSRLLNQTTLKGTPRQDRRLQALPPRLTLPRTPSLHHSLWIHPQACH